MPQKVLENLKNPVKTVKTHNTLKQVKKYTSASRKRVTHTEQMKLRDKEPNQTNTFELKAFLWHV